MTTQTLYIESFSTNNGLLTPNNALGSTTATWTTNVDNAAWDAIAEFPTPSQAQANGTHTFLVRVRKDAGSNNPNFQFEVQAADGTVLATYGPTAVTSTTGINATVTVPAATLMAASGGLAGIRIRMVGSATGGGPSARSVPQIDYVSWSGDFTPLLSAPPVAHAGTDQTVYAGDTVTLDGTTSTDDVGITSYLWEQVIDSGAGSAVFVAQSNTGADALATSRTVSILNAQAGDLVLGLFNVWSDGSVGTTTIPPGATLLSQVDIGSGLNGGTIRQTLWAKIVDIEDSWMVTNSVNNWCAAGAVVYRGGSIPANLVNLLVDFDTTPTGTVAASAPMLTASAAINDVLLILSSNDNDGSGTHDPATGFTERLDSNAHTVDELKATSAGTVNTQGPGLLYDTTFLSGLVKIPVGVGLPSVTLNNANTSTATFTAPSTPGDYEFKLTVTDADNQTSVDNIIIHVLAVLSTTTLWHNQGGTDDPVTQLLWHTQGGSDVPITSVAWHSQA